MNPYQSLEQRAFWAPSVGRRDAEQIEDLWRPKMMIRPKHRISTFGSCFAQHIGQALKARDFIWHVTEPGPKEMLEESAKRFNYGVFTCRTGNIYTTSLLRQWVDWSIHHASVPDEVWEMGGRYYDPFRPAIEPDGFASQDEVIRSRSVTLKAFRRSIIESDLFVFTLGLTESWFNIPEGYEYPMCPGTIAGEFIPDKHKFVNQSFKDVYSNLVAALKQMRAENKKLRVLLTVSPVPLTATMSGDHVLVATTRSKSILRAVASEVADRFPWVDYFPSYEIIASAPFGGRYYKENKRSVDSAGVDHVMNQFFAGLSNKKEKVGANAMAANGQGKAIPRPAGTAKQSADEVACEEEFLEAFSSPSERSE